MFFKNSKASFTSRTGQVQSYDAVQYGNRFNQEPYIGTDGKPREGLMIEALPDGDAYVLFRDTQKVEMVKWPNLCKIPMTAELAALGKLLK